MNAPTSPREHLVALASFAPRLARAAWAGGVAFLVGLVVTIILSLLTSRLYRSEAVLAYERGVQGSALGGEEAAGRSIGGRLKDMVTSRTRLEGLIKEMKLYRSVIEKRGLVEATEEMRRYLSISSREGYTHRVTYDGESPDLAKSVLERVVNGVVEEDRQRRAKEADETKRFLDAERRHADEDLEEQGEHAGGLSDQASPARLRDRRRRGAPTGGLIRAADRDRLGASGGEVASLEMQAAQLEESLAAAGRSPERQRRAGPRSIPSCRRRASALRPSSRRPSGIWRTSRCTSRTSTRTSSWPCGGWPIAETAQRQAERAAASWRPPAPSDGRPPARGRSRTARAAALRRALAAVRQQIAVTRGRSQPRVELPKTSSSVVTIDTDWTRLNRDVSEARERQSQLEAKQFQAELAATLTAAGQGGQLVVVDPPFRPEPSDRGRAVERSRWSGWSDRSCSGSWCSGCSRLSTIGCTPSATSRASWTAASSS